MAKRKIVDAHQHFWDLDHGYAYPWLQDKAEGEGMLGNLAPIAKTYLPADYLRDTASYDVVKSVHIEAVPLDPLKETAWLAGLGGTLPTAVVGLAPLADPKVEAILAAHAANPQARGVRQIVNWHANPKLTFTPADLLADSAWQAGYALLGKYNLSFDAQLYAGQMDEMLVLARRHPETRVIVNHAGMPAERDAAGVAGWRDGIRALASADNVAFKISGFGMVEHRWTTESIRPFVLEAIDVFGTGRVMFGSNFPVDRLYSPFDVLYGAFETIVGGFSAAEQDQLFRTSAERWYRI